MIRNFFKYCIAFLGVYSGLVRLRKLMRRKGQNSIRIVNYHQVRRTDRKKFERQIRYYTQKYRILSMSEAVDIIHTHKKNYGRCLVVTFDDGFKNNVEVAVPTLKKYDIPACFFVTSDFISIKPGDQKQLEFYRKNIFHLSYPEVNMNWKDVRTLIRLGFEVGSHTHTHRRLSSLSREEVLDELAESKQCIETHAGQPVRHFSWPYGTLGDLNPDFRKLVRQQGYVSCCSGVRGLNYSHSDVFYLGRDDIKAHWPLFLVKFFIQ